jgi:hypothetical protein
MQPRASATMWEVGNRIGTALRAARSVAAELRAHKYDPVVSTASNSAELERLVSLSRDWSNVGTEAGQLDRATVPVLAHTPRPGSHHHKDRHRQNVASNVAFRR